VFPGLQGGPFEHAIGAKAVCFKEAMRPSYKKYIKQVVLNSKAMANEFKKEGIRIVSGGTDNHLMVLDLSQYDTKRIEKELENVNIYLNRNVIPFDKKSPFNPSGVRIGTPAITSRGMKEKQCKEIASLIVKLINNLDNEKAKKEIKANVLALTKRFRIYEDFRW